MVLAPVDAAPVTKVGVLSKLGGGAGGHKNWKDRFFVLSDHVYYYNSKKDYEKAPLAALGRVNLTAYFVARSDADALEFTVHAYPKVRRARARMFDSGVLAAAAVAAAGGAAAPAAARCSSIACDNDAAQRSPYNPAPPPPSSPSRAARRPRRKWTSG
jgi:hypothetical protein